MGDEDTPGTEVEAPAPKLNPITGQPWTDEERQAQSERAKELVAQGKIGGARHGRRKKPPAYAVIAAEAQRNGRAMGKELVKIALHGPTPKLKMDAIKQLTDLELKAQQNRREEEEHLLQLPREELERQVLRRLAELTGEDYDIDIDDDDIEEDDEDDGDEADEEDQDQVA